MKALGISFGRKMQNSEIMVKQVLKQMEKRGFETSFIRACDLNIKPCTGCNACVMSLLAGKSGACVIKDDMKIIDEAIYEADAVVVCAPVYVLSPSGLFKTVCDRLSVSHDQAFRVHARELGEKQGLPEEQLVDKRFFKPRAAGLLSVGGAKTKNWTSFGYPSMFQITFSGWNVVDNYGAYNGMEYQHLVANEKLMTRMTKMGDNLADALSTEGGLDKWYGEEEGTCPVCHCDMLTILHDKGRVECPVCGIEGELTMKDGQINVAFSEEEQKRSRLKYPGKLEHYLEIKNAAANMKFLPDLQERLKDYK